MMAEFDLDLLWNWVYTMKKKNHLLAQEGWTVSYPDWRLVKLSIADSELQFIMNRGSDLQLQYSNRQIV